MYAFAIMRWRENSAKGVICTPKTPESEQTVARLRNEIALSSDAETLVGAGMTLQGHSSAYAQYCNGDAGEVTRLGEMLVDKALNLDPTLGERYQVRHSKKTSAEGPGISTRYAFGERAAQQRLIHQEKAVYPLLAKQAHIQGTVTFQITVDTEGRVKQVELISGHPLLVAAAQQAVMQYRYEPLYLEGAQAPQPFKATVRVQLIDESH
jgi:TonB family protein